MSSSAFASEFSITAVAAPEYDAMFARTDGWIGADGDYSLALDKDTVLWLYSDTFVGKVRDNKRIDCKMINNSVALQRLESKKSPEFFYNVVHDGTPSAFITPSDASGYFWLFHGAMTTKGLYLFLMHVEHSDESPVFPFKLTGVSVGHVANPSAPPAQWNLTQTRLPFSRFAREESIFFGSSVMKVGSYFYVYGVDALRRQDNTRPNAMIVARVPEDKLGDFAAWRFWSGGKWGNNFEHCDPLFDHAPTEFSVSYVPGIKRYAAVYTEGGIFGKIAVRLSQNPEGPWGEATIVYDCPDKHWHEKTYSYAAKAHPELARNPNELIVTYATNSMNFPDLFDDARIYWPRFVRVTFGDGKADH